MNNPVRARQIKVVGCSLCGLVCRPMVTAGHAARCPRCRARLHARHPASITRAWALLITALLCYVPASLLPVMYSSLFGNGRENTIIAGVVAFWHDGSYGVALLIFIASVVIPCFKFLALGLLLITAQRRSAWAMAERTILYRLTELIGYWSMLDVVVVAVVSALLKFQLISDVEPRSGILFFGLVVVFTMLSARQYDPRLIWDGEKK